MKKAIKKFAAVAMSGLIIASAFAGCSQAKNDTSSKDSYTVGVVQLVQHNALDSATKGFQDKLNELMKEAGKTVDIQIKNANNDKDACAQLSTTFVNNNVDLIMANGTPALAAAANATANKKTPVVATSITDFGTALDIDGLSPTDPTGINVTGSNDLAPLDKQAEQLMTLFPNAKTVGCLYCSSEANSLFQVKGVKSALEAKGVKAEFYSFSDSNDIQAVATKAAKASDVIYIPTDNTCASNGPVISAACEAENTPIIAGEEGIFEKTNAVATFSISFYEIGQKAGEMAFEILTKGTDPATMNVYQTPNLTYYYNADMAKKYNVTVPSDYQAYDFSAAEAAK